MNNFLVSLELRAFSIEFKKVKLTAINFHGRTNGKHFMQTQLLRFCEDTAKVSSLPFPKSTYMLLAKKKIPILWIELQTSKIQKPYI